MLWRPPRPVLMTTDPIGGVWRYTVDLCRELADCPIALASMGGRLSAAQRAEIGNLGNVELFESAYKLEWMDDPWDDVRAAGAWLSAIRDRVQPSLVHLNQFAHGALDWQVPCLVVGHSCVYSWFRAVKRIPPGPEWYRYGEQVARGLRGADRVTAPTGWMLAALAENYGRFTAATPIYNGCAPRRFSLATKEPFVLTAGRLWDQAKNIGSLDRIAAELAWPIFAAGEVRAPNGSAATLRHLRILGRQDPGALAQWMARAAIFAAPAYYEPFGLAILEAALARCALVLGDIPSLREIWGDAAVFVPPDDRLALRTALAALIGDHERRGMLARAARARAIRFTSARAASAYRKLYREMVSAAAKPAAHLPPAESASL